MSFATWLFTLSVYKVLIWPFRQFHSTHTEWRISSWSFFPLKKNTWRWWKLVERLDLLIFSVFLLVAYCKSVILLWNMFRRRRWRCTSDYFWIYILTTFPITAPVKARGIAARKSELFWDIIIINKFIFMGPFRQDCIFHFRSFYSNTSNFSHTAQ